MKNSKIFTTLSLAALATIAAAPLQAQVSTASARDAAIAHTPPPATTTTQKAPAGNVWVKGQIIHVDNVELVFSELNNPRVVHTFTYTAGLKSKMQRVVNNTTYKYGDQVRVLYQPETTVALKIHLKHSKTSS